jgi:hypothetical protein
VLHEEEDEAEMPSLPPPSPIEDLCRLPSCRREVELEIWGSGRGARNRRWSTAGGEGLLPAPPFSLFVHARRSSCHLPPRPCSCSRRFPFASAPCEIRMLLPDLAQGYFKNYAMQQHGVAHETKWAKKQTSYMRAKESLGYQTRSRCPGQVCHLMVRRVESGK